MCAGRGLSEGRKQSLGVCLETVVAEPVTAFAPLGQPSGRGSVALPFIPDGMWLQSLTDGSEWGDGFLYQSTLLRQILPVKLRVGVCFLVEKFRMNPVLPDQWGPLGEVDINHK